MVHQNRHNCDFSMLVVDNHLKKGKLLCKYFRPSNGRKLLALSINHAATCQDHLFLTLGA